MKPFTDFDFTELAGAFSEVAGEYFSGRNLTKFLCGINTPAFSRLKLKGLQNFGALESYPFLQVQSQVENWLCIC